ncbi:helix-turn-helix domain-containing protein [Iamia majanohamensis]|uniref:Helix-turn-helix domain-containing protein n=1 Tax=Iamia majanohamensis TaxID=467976 RepID=A0AAE9YB84_9ACTN|nr:helix-turn-helix domain-containing protein [Iamia majanohamensis]WCO67918.1 helix-turn-helix domain-containing protein [Iamia majanohamensis]
MPTPTLLSTAEAAKRADVNVRTIHRWVEQGRLAPLHKLPGGTGAYLFTPDAVDLAALRKGAA